MLDTLLENSALYINQVTAPHKRYFYDTIDHTDRLIGIIGARGVGKTTYILDWLRHHPLPLHKKLYVSADSIALGTATLVDVAKAFAARGGEILAIDEIHKYKHFETELKQIYDMLPLHVIFSGSSAIELEHAKADLSRRAVIYRVHGMSYREFLLFKGAASLSAHSLSDIIAHHSDIAHAIMAKIRPLEYWDEYLRFGYYPFYFENPRRYPIKLNETINTAIEVDIPSIFPIKYANITHLKKLVELICSSEPYTLNIQELSSRIGIDRDTLYLYFEYLHRGRIFHVIRSRTRGDNILTKPDKIYLGNPNLNHSYCTDASSGTIRETAFATLLSTHHTLHVPSRGDFLVDERYLFEVGGRSKGFKQIKGIADSFVVADNIEIGFGNKIPLWLFGFLY